jgi:hypothetical protein
MAETPSSNAEAEAEAAAVEAAASTNVTTLSTQTDGQAPIPDRASCQEDERVSTNPCNSLHPSVFIDGMGNSHIAWHDNRDGTLEVYSKTIGSGITTDEVQNLLNPPQDSGDSGDGGGGTGTGTVDGTSPNVEFRNSNAQVTLWNQALNVLPSGQVAEVESRALRSDQEPLFSFNTGGLLGQPKVMVGSLVTLLGGAQSGSRLVVTRITDNNNAECRFVDGNVSSLPFRSGQGGQPPVVEVVPYEIQFFSQETQASGSLTTSECEQQLIWFEQQFRVFGGDLGGSVEIGRNRGFATAGSLLEQQFQIFLQQCFSPVSGPSGTACSSFNQQLIQFNALPPGSPSWFSIASTLQTLRERCLQEQAQGVQTGQSSGGNFAGTTAVQVSSQQPVLLNEDGSPADVSGLELVGPWLGTGETLLSSLEPTTLNIASSGETSLVSGSRASARFPSMAADAFCRSHVVYHDDTPGQNHIFYVQMGYGNFLQKCVPGPGVLSGSSPIYLGDGSFAERTSPGEAVFVFQDSSGTILRWYDISGQIGQRVSYGDKSPPPDRSFRWHVLYKEGAEDPEGSAEWFGFSRGEDKDDWDDIAEILPTVPTPTFLSQDNAFANEGDFGQSYDFTDLGFMVMTPPDLGVDVEYVKLPILPREVPSNSAIARTASIQEDDITEAPKRPLPPTFVDPINVSFLLSSPTVTEDEGLPSRFVLEGDESGTVFTNLVTEDPRGRLNRIVFMKQEEGDSFKFILSFRKCGDGPCAVKPSSAFDSGSDDETGARFFMNLQVWRGPDYRVDSGFADAAANSVTKVFEKRVGLLPGEDMSTFTFAPGDLKLERGSIYYFVPTPDLGFEYFITGLGGGNSVWTTDGEGVMTQYNVPFTLNPFEGMDAPVYYEGILSNVPRSDTESAQISSANAVLESTFQEADSLSLCVGTPQKSEPFRLTESQGENSYPAVDLTSGQNIWLVFQSTREGAEDIYAARFFGACSTWNSSATGGEDIRVTRFAANGEGTAKFARVASDPAGNAHIAFQVTDLNGQSQIYYSKVSWDGDSTEPLKITNSSGDAIMPDIAVSRDESDRIVVNIVWHDNRFGNWEIMSASSSNGGWTSSAFGGSDVRVTSSGEADSMFPRIASDNNGNLRVVFHSNRSGRQEIYMSTFILSAMSWDSSGQEGEDIKVSNGPTNSLFADISVVGERTCVTWHDDRFNLDDPSVQEEVMVSKCSAVGRLAPWECMPPLVTNVEHKMDFDFQIVNAEGIPIDFTETEDVFLRINAPTALFWRATNSDESYMPWEPFSPFSDLETMIVPWRLSCGNGLKEVCVQVQDDDLVSFPTCRQVTLIKPPEKFEIELFSDIDMTQALPEFGNFQVAKSGEVYVKLIAPKGVITSPEFEVIQKGTRGTFNQEFQRIVLEEGDPELALGKEVFKGRFSVFKDDGIFNRDGLARVIIRSKDECPSLPIMTSSPEDIAGDEITVPLPPELEPTFSGFSGIGTGAWSTQAGSMPMEAEDFGVAISPTILDAPFVFSFGAIAQPFLVDSAFVGGDLVVSVRMAAREVPDWLSAFNSREITATLVSGFSESIVSVASTAVRASSLPRVTLDVISGLLEEPQSASEISLFDITIPSVPAVTAGTTLTLVLEDEAYPDNVSEFGANAKLFVVAIGSDVPSGEVPHSTRDL